MNSSVLLSGRLAVALSAALCAAATSRIAHAQSPPSGAPTTPVLTPTTSATPADPEVAAMVARGRAAFDERRYGDARVIFEEVVRREPTPQRLYALGMACRNVSRYAQAIAAFERFLAEPSASADPALLDEVREQIAAMHRLMGRLSLAVTPDAATAMLDGHALTLPADQFALDPGNHVLDLAAPQHRAEHREFTVESGAAVQFQVALVAEAHESPRIIVEPTPATAAVYVDGMPAGHGRIERVLPPGPHVVEVRAEGHASFRREVRLTSSGTLRIDAVLATRGTPGWVLPTAIAGGVVLVGGTILGVWLATRDTGPNLHPAWGTVTQ